MPEYKVAAVDDVPAGGARAVRVEGKQIGLFNAGGELYAIDDACPHMRADLSCGALRDRTVLCAWHGWQFDLATGQCLNVEWARVRTYPVSARKGAIYVTLEPEPEPEERDEPIPQIVWKESKP